MKITSGPLCPLLLTVLVSVGTIQGGGSEPMRISGNVKSDLELFQDGLGLPRLSDAQLKPAVTFERLPAKEPKEIVKDPSVLHIEEVMPPMQPQERTTEKQVEAAPVVVAAAAAQSSQEGKTHPESPKAEEDILPPDILGEIQRDEDKQAESPPPAAATAAQNSGERPLELSPQVPKPEEGENKQEVETPAAAEASNLSPPSQDSPVKEEDHSTDIKKETTAVTTPELESPKEKAPEIDASAVHLYESPNEELLKLNPLAEDISPPLLQDAETTTTTLAKPAVTTAAAPAETFDDLIKFMFPLNKGPGKHHKSYRNKCAGVTCSPPNFSQLNCRAKLFPVEIKDYYSVTSYVTLSDCCPIWFCTGEDGSVHTHYGLTKVGKNEAPEQKEVSIYPEHSFKVPLLRNGDHGELHSESLHRAEPFQEMLPRKMAPQHSSLSAFSGPNMNADEPRRQPFERPPFRPQSPQQNRVEPTNNFGRMSPMRSENFIRDTSKPLMQGQQQQLSGQNPNNGNFYGGRNPQAQQNFPPPQHLPTASPLGPRGMYNEQQGRALPPFFYAYRKTIEVERPYGRHRQQRPHRPLNLESREEQQVEEIEPVAAQPLVNRKTAADAKDGIIALDLLTILSGPFPGIIGNNKAKPNGHLVAPPKQHSDSDILIGFPDDVIDEPVTPHPEHKSDDDQVLAKSKDDLLPLISMLMNSPLLDMLSNPKSSARGSARPTTSPSPEQEEQDEVLDFEPATTMRPRHHQHNHRPNNLRSFNNNNKGRSPFSEIMMKISMGLDGPASQRTMPSRARPASSADEQSHGSPALFFSFPMEQGAAKKNPVSSSSMVFRDFADEEDHKEEVTTTKRPASEPDNEKTSKISFPFFPLFSMPGASGGEHGLSSDTRNTAKTSHKNAPLMIIF